MRFTSALHARVTGALYARARFTYTNKRGERVSPAYTNRDQWRHDAMHRIVDPAHDRWFITKESLESTFEWNSRTIFQAVVGLALLGYSYYYFRNMVDQVNIIERGVTLKQVEREHAELFTFEPFMSDHAAFATKIAKNHDFSPVHTGRYRQSHRC